MRHRASIKTLREECKMHETQGRRYYHVIYIYIHIYIYMLVISSQRSKTVGVDYSRIEYMRNII